MTISFLLNFIPFCVKMRQTSTTCCFYVKQLLILDTYFKFFSACILQQKAFAWFRTSTQVLWPKSSFVDYFFFCSQQWNETYLHYHKVDPKQTYYLSMEFLQGRALTNAIGNLDIQDAYADALNKLGHELEEIVEQVIQLTNTSKVEKLIHMCACVQYIDNKKKMNFAGKRCSTGKWWSRKACFLFSRLYGNTKFASMGIWFKIQVWTI